MLIDKEKELLVGLSKKIDVIKHRLWSRKFISGTWTTKTRTIEWKFLFGHKECRKS